MFHQIMFPASIPLRVYGHMTVQLDAVRHHGLSGRFSPSRTCTLYVNTFMPVNIRLYIMEVEILFILLFEVSCTQPRDVYPLTCGV